MELLGFDAFTGGNHSFANMDEIAAYMNRENSLQIRPANFYNVPGYSIPGRGQMILEKS